MAEMGKYIIQGLLNGLKATWGTVTAWIQEKLQWLLDKIEAIKKSFSGISGAAKSGLGGSIGGAFGGAVIPANREFLAVLGDQKSGTNVEAPLETIKQANKEALMEIFNQLGLSGGGNGQEINLNLTVECEGYRLIHLMQRLNGEYFKQHGKYAFTG